MIINVLNLKDELLKLNKLIDSYESNYLNLYNEINVASFLWHDGNAIKFFNESNMEKIKVKKTLDEIIAIKDLYDFIIQRYETIGSKIDYNFYQKENLLTKFNNYLNELEVIIESYSNLDLTFCDGERSIILKQKNDLIILKNNAQNIFDNVKKTLNEIEEIERDINLRISRINIEIIK